MQILFMHKRQNATVKTGNVERRVYLKPAMYLISANPITLICASGVTIPDADKTNEDLWDNDTSYDGGTFFFGESEDEDI